jgi:hypothetical protein
MVWDKRESWMELCELAAQEKGPQKADGVGWRDRPAVGSEASVCGEDSRFGYRESC